NEGVVGEYHLADAGIDRAVAQIAQRRLAEAVGLLDDLEPRGGVADGVLIEPAGGLADIRGGAAMQHADMRAVELAFEPLQPVAMHDAATDERVRRRAM